MADVDLDVHGVRYAEVYTELKRDMKLRGVGFVALLDFTTVDTLKGTLERVIAEKMMVERKVEFVCYYKKRRRGGVFINNERDVMLACCEYPLVTRSGKPAPDTYIKVGVMLSPAGFRHTLTAVNLTVRESLALQRHADSGLDPDPPVPEPGPPLRLVDDPPKPFSLLMPLRKIAPKNNVSLGRALGTLVSEVALEPPAKRVCLPHPVQWSPRDEVHGDQPSPSHPMYTMVATPPSNSISPLLIDEHHPTTLHIKPEPQDSDDELAADTHSNQSTGFHDDSTIDNQEDPEDGEGSAGSHNDAGLCCDPSLKMMWDQLKGLESRLNNMEGNMETPASNYGNSSGGAKTRTNNKTLNIPNSASGLAEQIIALERRVIAMEKMSPTEPQISSTFENKFARMEQKLSTTLLTIDKLGKSVAMVNRKQTNTNSAVSAMSKSLNSLSRKFTKTQVTMDKIYMLLQNKS